MDSSVISGVKDYLLSLQSRICAQLEEADGSGEFIKDHWQRKEGGGGLSRVLAGGQIIEKAGVNFSHVSGDRLPPSASAHREELAGRSFQAMGVSVVVHPDNPHIPTTHMNVRFFVAEKAGEPPIWWFGGGYDLTPYYLYDDDAVHWHQTAKNACDPFGKAMYFRLKKQCDDYFYLKHREESRGIGGLFFDDFSEGGFENSFAFLQSVGNSFLPAYLPILKKRQGIPFAEAQKNYQLHRRGRYVEFNLVFDRGTLFGLQSGGRTESILMSLPPVVQWDYDWQVAEGSEEARLLDILKQPKAWIACD